MRLLKLYKMTMRESHFGDGRLEKIKLVPSAQTIFSALFLEAMKLNKEVELLTLANSKSFVLSNAFPYYLGLYFPKPLGYPLRQAEVSLQDRMLGKKLKKLHYINYLEFDDFVSGNLDRIDELLADEARLYSYNIWTKKGEDPYRLSSIRYAEGVSLAFISIENTLIDTLMSSMQYQGIGGKKSTGFGRFSYTTENLEPEIIDRINSAEKQNHLLLTDSLPKTEMLESSVVKAKFLLDKKSGFVFSNSSKENVRKQDVYMFKAGSTFQNIFEGEILNVAPDNFDHPVWSYAKPLFLSLEV